MNTDNHEANFHAYARSILKPQPTLRRVVHYGAISGQNTIRVELKRIANIGGVDMVLVKALEGRPFDISHHVQISAMPAEADMRPDTHAQFIYWSNMRWVSPLALLADRDEPDAIPVSIPVNTFERSNA